MNQVSTEKTKLVPSKAKLKTTISELLADRSILFFIFLSYSITWIILLPLIFVYDDLSYFDREFWHITGSVGPTIAAIIVYVIYGSRDQLKILFKSCFKYSGIGLLLYALLPFLVTLIVFPVELLIGSFSWKNFVSGNFLDTREGKLLFPLASLTYGVFEEIGWRGFLLPKLQSKYSALKSTLILSVIWWLWHVPMFFYRFDLLFAIFLMYPLLLSGSIVFTYLFNESGGSLLMMFIIHVSYDLLAAHELGISVYVLSTIWIFITIRLIKIGGKETLGAKEKKILIFD